MNFFQHSNEPRGSLSSTLSSSTSQYRASFLEETPNHQNLKDERIRNIKSKLQSIPSQNSKYEDNNINLFNIQHSSLSSQSNTSQNQNINNINLLQNPLYQSKSNSNNFIQSQQKSYLGTQINMERKQKTQIRGSIRSENEEEQSLISMREKNALFFEEDESRRRSFTPSQSQSSSNESFSKNQHVQKAGGFFGNKLQEIKLRRFQIDAAKLIIDRLVKICYKSFNDIYDYSLKNLNRNNFNNPNVNKSPEYFKQQTKSSTDKCDKDLKLKIVNNKTNQLQNSSSLSQLHRKFESDVCLSDRKQNPNSQNIIHTQSQNQLHETNFTSKFQQQQSHITSQNSSDNLKINDRKLSIQINIQNSKPLYRHISPCDRLSHTNTSSSQISSRNRNASSIITNNNNSNTIYNKSNSNHSSSSFHFSMSQNNNFNCSPSGQIGISNNYQQNQTFGNQQYFQQLSNSFNNLEYNLRRASSHENKMALVDNSFENGFARQKSTEKVQLINHTQCNSQERNTNNSTYSKMVQQFKQNNNKISNQAQQNAKLSNENNSLFSHKMGSGIQKQNDSTSDQFLRSSPQRKSTGGYIQNNVFIPKSFLDSNQRPLQKQSHSSKHLNSYFQTSFFKQNINEDSSNSQHNIHTQMQSQFQNQDKPYENCLTEQSFFRMSTNGTRNPTNNNGDLLSVRINTNESNNYNFANTYTNRGSYRESEQTSDILLTSSFQKSINNQLRQEIENRRSFKNQKQDSLDCIFDDLPHKNAKKGGSLIDYEEENEMKVSSIQKLKQEFNEIIKSSFQNEIKSSSFKKEEQQKIVQSTSNRVSFNNSNENEEQNNHNIYNQNTFNINNNANTSTDQNQQLTIKNSQQNSIKQKIQDQFQVQLLKQQQLSDAQRGQQDEKSCISARNNTSAFIVENLLNQEEVKSFSCYDEDLIKQQDITIHQLSTKNQNIVAEQSNFKDDLIFDKTVHSFDFNLSLRESENNLKQKLNIQQQDLSQSPNQNQGNSIQNISQKHAQSNIQDGQIEIIQEIKNIQSEQNFDSIQQNILQLQRKENVQFNGSFGRLSVDSTPRNNEDISQLDNSKKPLSYFARQQSEEVDGNQNDIFLQQEDIPDNEINNHLKYNQENQNMKAEQHNTSNKLIQQQQQNIDGEEGDEESSRFSFELKNTLDEFQSQQHLEQILFNQNNQTANEDISIIEKNNKSNFSIFIDKNDRNNMSIFNSNNDELLNTVTNSQINFQQHNLNNQSDNILIAQTFPYSSSGHNFNKNEVQDFNDISFDQNQHHLADESNKKQYFENTKQAYQEDNGQKHFGETKKQLFMDSNHLTQSNDSNDQNTDANLMIITQIIQGNSLSQESLRVNQQKQKEEGLGKFQQKIFYNHLNEATQNQQIDLFDDEQIIFEANEFTPPRQKKINPINQYSMPSNAESSPIIDKDIVQGGLGLKVFEFSLKMQTILKAIQMKNLRESFISVVIYSQLKSYLMSSYQQQLLQQQLQNEQLQAQRVAQIQNIPYYYQSQFSTIYEQQNETCSDIHQPQSINASKLLDSRSLYDSKSLEQFNLEMNKVTVFNSLQFTQNQIQNASSQHITQSSIIESNFNNSQNTSSIQQQPSSNIQNVMHTEIVTEIDSNDNGIKQFWGLSIISSKLQKQAFNCWKNSYKIKQNQNQITNFVNEIQFSQQNQLKDAFETLIKFNHTEEVQNFRVKIIQLSQILERLQKNFMKQALYNLKVNSIQKKAAFEQQLRYSLHSVIQIFSNAQQDNVIWSLQQLKKQTIYKTKLIHTMHKVFKQKMNQTFLDQLKYLFDLQKRREFALQPVLFNYRRFQNQLLSKYLERWRMQLYHKSSHFDKFSALSSLSNIFKQNIQTSIQLAYKKIQLNSLLSTNKEKILKNILLQVLIHIENKKKEQKQIGFEKLFNLYKFKKHRESVLQNLLMSKIIREKISSSACSTIDLLNSEHESIKQTLKNLKNNLQKVKIESLIKGFSHVHQKIQYNQQKIAFRKILHNCRQKQKICKGLSVLKKIQDGLTTKKQKACFAKLKYLIQDKLQLKKNQKSQKQIFCIFLKTLLQKKLQNQKRTALLQIKQRAEQYLQDKRDKKLIYTESSMFVVKCKLLLGTLDRIFKKNLYQYPFQLIYGCQPQKYIAALQFYQNIANQTQKASSINQSKKQKIQSNQNQQQQTQTIKNFHASTLLNLSKSKSPMKKIQVQHSVKHEIIKNLVNKNDESSKQQNSQINNNSKKDQLANQKGRVNQNLSKTQQNQNQAQNDHEKNKPKTSQSQIIPSQHRNQTNQQSNINAFKSQIITPTNVNQQAQSMNNIIYQGFNLNQMENNDKIDHLSLSSKGKCITFGGSSSPKHRDYQNKQNTSIPNINNISNFMLNSSPNSTERIIASSSNIKSPQNSNSNKQQVVYDSQKQQQINLSSNQKQLPYFQHNRNYSSGSIPSSLPIMNSSINQSSSIILFNNNELNQNQFN
ncbi:hypothetical protein ABPG72_012017 [Tetrahymena utriculariae]